MHATAPQTHQIGWSPRLLRGSVVFWFALALVGQWAFFVYIAAFYGGSLLDGDFTVWNRLQALGRTPYLVGDVTGNWVFLSHALGAGLVALGGVLQLIPAIRKHAPDFHRWNGRIFVSLVTVLSLSGFYLEWIRDEPPTTLSGYATSINGLLILGFAYLAIRSARAKEFAWHRKWAICLFLVSNAQWFTRIGLFGYLVSCKLLGIADAHVGSFFAIWKFGAFLLPLGFAWLYFQSPRRGLVFQACIGALLGSLTLPMLIGMVAYGMFTVKLATGAALEF